MNCDYPRQVFAKDMGIPIVKRCGGCDPCKRVDAMELAVRAAHELQTAENAALVTLTYDDESLPSDGKLDYRHLARFMSCVRHKGKTQYLAAGEYGKDNRRPHWHLLIFGPQITEDEVSRWWQKGIVEVQKPEIGSCFYVAGTAHEKYTEDRVLSSSQNLGWEYAKDHLQEFNDEGSVILCDSKFPVPRSYINRFKTELGILRSKRTHGVLLQTQQFHTERLQNKDRKKKPKTSKPYPVWCK